MTSKDSNSLPLHVLERIISEVSNLTSSLPPPSDKNERHFFQIRAAFKFGFVEPFSNEQRALNTMLSGINANRDQIEYAWKLYAAQSGHENNPTS